MTTPDLLITCLLGVGFLLFLIWGYGDDYRRNPRAFVRTLLSMPLSLIWPGMSPRLKQWAEEPKQTPSSDSERDAG